jgi:hypothetical protein
MLFNGSNLTASANHLEWNNKQWSIVNHFIPFTEEEVGSPERFESDFMVRYLEQLPPLFPSSVANQAASMGGVRGGLPRFIIRSQPSIASRQIIMASLLCKYRCTHSKRRIKLNRSDVGWYQIRKALQARNASGDYAPVNFKPFEEAYKALTEKLQPMVYELGF